MPRIKFDGRNKQQLAFFKDKTTKYPMFQGGYGAGKSHVLWYWLVESSWINRGMPGALLSPSLPEFKRDMLEIIEEFTQKYSPGTRYFEKGRYGAFVRFPWTRAPLYILSAETGRVKGPTLAYAGINEFSLIKKEMITHLAVGRLRAGRAKALQCGFVGTPEDEWLWLDEWVALQTKEKKIKIYRASTYDNPYNHVDYGRDLEINLGKKASQLYVYGHATRLDKPYFYWAYEPKLNDFAVTYDPDKRVEVGLDFNVGRMCASFWHVFDRQGLGKQIACFGELELTGDSNTEKMGLALSDLFGTEHHKIQITCDASGNARKTSSDRTDVQILRDFGFLVRCKAGNPRVRESQKLCNAVLDTKRALINPKKAPKLKRDFLKVEQKEDFEMDKSKPELTHMGDGFRYIVEHEFPNFFNRNTRRDKYNYARLGV